MSNCFRWRAMRRQRRGNEAKKKTTLCNIQTSFQGPLQTTYHIYTMKYLGSTFPTKHVFQIKCKQTTHGHTVKQQTQMKNGLHYGKNKRMLKVEPKDVP